MIHHETLPDCCNKADCCVEIQYSAGEVAGGFLPLDGSGPENHGKYQPLSGAVLAEDLIVLLGVADWRNSGCNWPGTDFVA